jgi:hypothetical protein
MRSCGSFWLALHVKDAFLASYKDHLAKHGRLQGTINKWILKDKLVGGLDRYVQLKTPGA